MIAGPVDDRRPPPAGRIGGAALFGEGRLTLGRGERNGPAVSVASVSRVPSRAAKSLAPPVRAELAAGPGRSERGGPMNQMRMQHRPAFSDKRGHIAKAGNPGERLAPGLGREPARRRPQPGAPAAANRGGPARRVALASASRRTRSPGGGRSETWHSRINTISAAARRSGAVSTSPTPFSSICHARASTGTER